VLSVHHGLETHAILYYPSPDKEYGFDSYDVLGDENSLFNPQDEDDQQRLDSHRTMSGWKEVLSQVEDSCMQR
jgi:hypothetical protein